MRRVGWVLTAALTFILSEIRNAWRVISREVTASDLSFNRFTPAYVVLCLLGNLSKVLA